MNIDHEIPIEEYKQLINEQKFVIEKKRFKECI